MKFLAIDIETTGLDPSRHRITEFAAILADTDPTVPVKTFYRWIHPENFVWSAFCLTLHAEWLKEVILRVKNGLHHLAGKPMICNTHTALVNQFCQWLNVECDHPIPKDSKWEKLTAAGKNFQGFDARFLDSHGFPALFRHRALDPVMLYAEPIDQILPDLELCKTRAIHSGATGLVPGVAHNALDDAMDVVKLIQHGLKWGKS